MKYNEEPDEFRSEIFSRKLFPLLLHAFIIVITLIALYLIVNKGVWAMAFSSAAAFSLPVSISFSWALFNNIPEKEYKHWIPNKTLTDGASLFLDSLPVKLRISKKLEDLHEGIYEVNIPYYIKLGDYFSRFLYEQNKKSATAIEDTDIKKNRYAWEFFVIDLYGLQQRRLDPNLNLVQNKIKKDSNIRVRRLYESLKLLKHTQIELNEINK